MKLGIYLTYCVQDALCINGNDEKADPHMCSRVQRWVQARIRNLKLTALKMNEFLK